MQRRAASRKGLTVQVKTRFNIQHLANVNSMDMTEHASPVRLFCLITLMVLALLLAEPAAALINGQDAQTANLYMAPVRRAGGMDAEDVRFGFNVRVTDGSSPYLYQVEPTMTILSTGRILVGWKEAETHSGPGRRVGFAYSTDNGHTFSPNILMTPISPGEYQSDPWLVSDQQDNAYFVFLEYNGPGEGIAVAKTVNGGESWMTPVQASDTPGFDDKEMACIDASGNIYIVWDHFTDTDADLRFTKSTDGGATFQPTTTFHTPYIPAITCTPNGTLYVTTVLGPPPDYWPPTSIWFTKSTDGGAQDSSQSPQLGRAEHNHRGGYRQPRQHLRSLRGGLPLQQGDLRDPLHRWRRHMEHPGTG